MSKRFTDTNKFDDPWYCELSKDAKLLFEFVTSKCDVAGVFQLVPRIAKAYLGDVDFEALLKEFGNRIHTLPDGKWWIVKFCDFQYGELSEACKPHQAVVRLLNRHGIWDLYLSRHELLLSSKPLDKGINTLSEEYPKSCQTLEDKEKEKEKDNTLDLISEEPARDVARESLLVYAEYPRKVGKPDALRAIGKQLKLHPFEFLLDCTKRYAAARTGEDPNFTPHPATWFNEQRFNDDPQTWATQGRPKQTTTREREQQRTGINSTAGATIRDL